MRSLTDLQAECAAAGLATDGTESRVDLMNLLRGPAFNAAHEQDPMKARDLKHEIDWNSPDPAVRYAKVKQLNEWAANWVLEPKLDGCRMRLFMGAEGNTLKTGRRSDKTYRYANRTDNFPHLRDAVISGFEGTILDGEICAAVEGDASMLNASTALCNSGPERAVITQAATGRASFWAFDVMAVRGEDVTGYSWEARRELLEAIVKHLNDFYPHCSIYLVPVYEATGENADRCMAEGFEGAMLKSKQGVYRYGKRAAEWLKVKGFSTGDFFITGWEPGKGGFTGMVGSIEFSYYGPNGEVVGAGKFGNLELEQRKFMSAADGSLHTSWYGQVVEVMAQARTKTNRLRHAHLVRFRPDKDAASCLQDQIELFPKA